MALHTYQVPISAIVEETADSRTFELDAESLPPNFVTYRAGQFLSVHVIVNGEALTRQYSISGNRVYGDPFRITVKRVRGGVVSNWLFESAVVGSRLMIEPPAGRFVLADGDSDIFLLGAGAGVTPLFALASDALFRTRRSVRMLIANRDESAVIFAKHLQRLKERFGKRFEINHHFSSEQGRITESVMLRQFPEASAADIYVCGPSGFDQMAEKCFENVRGKGFRLFIERFGVERQKESKKIIPALHSYGVCTIAIRLNGRRFTFPGNFEASILDAALLASVQMPHSCGEGRCGSCIAKVTSGKIELDSRAALSAREKTAGFILTCQTSPRSEKLEIDFDI